MNIIHIIPSLGSGGAERMLSKIISEDLENKHTIIFYKKTSIVYDFTNADTHYLNIKSIKETFKLLHNLNIEKYEIVNSWMRANLFGVLYKLLFRKAKIIFNIRHDFPYQLGIKKILEHFVIWQSKFMDGTIFVSYSAYKNYSIKGYKNKNSTVITNGFETNKYNMYKNQNNRKQIIGYVGRYNQIKNQKRMLRIFNEINNSAKQTELWLVGANLEKLPIDTYVKNPSKVKLLGELKDLSEVYSSIDLLMLTSIKEGFPNVVGEAMSYGVPVATTDAGDSYSIIQNSGIKIESYDDPIKTSEKILTLLKNKIEVQQLSDLSYQRINKHYDIKDILKNYTLYYRYIKEL